MMQSAGPRREQRNAVIHQGLIEAAILSFNPRRQGDELIHGGLRGVSQELSHPIQSPTEIHSGWSRCP